MSERDLGEQLAEAELLAPGLIHEMRHPLMGIKVGLQLLEARLGEACEQEEWTMVKAQLARLEELFRGYQDLISPDRQTLGTFEVGAVVQRAVHLLTFRLRRLGPRFHCDLGGRDCLGVGSASAVLHSTTNVLTNAIDAVEQAGAGRIAVRVRVEPSSRACEVRVSDDGTGIAPEVCARLFEARFTTKAPGKGTGLGLHISRRMLSRTGGSMRLVELTEPGRLPWAKTEFCIALPLPLPPKGGNP